jgi:hypothetical protein
MKSASFWYLTPCSMARELLPDYTASHPKQRCSLVSIYSNIEKGAISRGIMDKSVVMNLYKQVITLQTQMDVTI